jgi:hypothetical protein
MNANLQAIVVAIATDVRYWAEGRASSPYSKLDGWCARASAELFKQLKEEDIDASIHVWNENTGEIAHVFVVVDDHVVDVTATQFPEFEDKPVVILHQREAEAYEFYQTKHVFHSVQELLKYQKKSRWPASQMAFA